MRWSGLGSGRRFAISKKSKSKKRDRGMIAEAGRFASRNRGALSIAGAGLAAAALLLGRRYRDQRVSRWSEDQPVGGSAI